MMLNLNFVYKIDSFFELNRLLHWRLFIFKWKGDFISLWQEGVESQNKVSVAFK